MKYADRNRVTVSVQYHMHCVCEKIAVRVNEMMGVQLMLNTSRISNYQIHIVLWLKKAHKC